MVWSGLEAGRVKGLRVLVTAQHCVWWDLVRAWARDWLASSDPASPSISILAVFLQIKTVRWTD